MSTITTTARNVALNASRVVAGLLGAMQLAGLAYFVAIAPGAGISRGALIDLPVNALLITGVLLKLSVAVWPGLSAGRRIAMGLAAVVIGVGTSLVKITAYDEPEVITFVALDAVLLTLLLLARRAAR